MTLSKITSTILVALIFVLIISGWTLSAQQSALEKRQADYQDVFALRSIIKNKIITPIDSYLTTGDAVQLLEAEKNSKLISSHLIKSNDINSDFIETDISPVTISDLNQLKWLGVGELLAKLHHLLKSDARAAGKLSGNTNALLIQNERETRFELESLLSYAKEARISDPVTADKVQSLAQQLLILITERSAIQQTNANNVLSGVESTSALMIKLITELDQLPSLGISAEEEVDDFALMMGIEQEETETTQTDLGQEAIDNLNYLVPRYLAELNRTIANQKSLSTTHSNIRQYIKNIDLLFLDYESKVAESMADTLDNQAAILLIICTGIILLILSSNAFLTMLGRRITLVNNIIKTYAKRDLENRADFPTITYELTSLKNSANALRENISTIVSSIRAKSDIVVKSSQNVRSLSDSVYNNIDLQMEQTVQISNATEQMTSSFKEVAESAALAAKNAEDVQTQFQKGNQTLQTTLSAVSELSKKVNETSHKISNLQSLVESVDNVVSMIEEIAEQTNLLALNAAIEAARAGEQGRGFAVVADEVRALAHKTSRSTLQISEITSAIREQSSSCVLAMEEQVSAASSSAEKGMSVVSEIETMLSSITEIVEQSMGIAATTEEQSQVAVDIFTNIKQINAFSNTIRSEQETVAKDSAKLETESVELLNSVSQFKVAREFEQEKALYQEPERKDINTNDVLF